MTEREPKWLSEDELRFIVLRTVERKRVLTYAESVEITDYRERRVADVTVSDLFKIANETGSDMVFSTLDHIKSEIEVAMKS